MIGDAGWCGVKRNPEKLRANARKLNKTSEEFLALLAEEQAS